MSNDSVNMISLLRKGLDVESLRQAAIAGNIANLDTPEYRRLSVKFEESLAKALDEGGKHGFEDAKAQLHAPLNTPVNANGNDVDLDTEVSEMVKNSLRHKTYTLLLKKKYTQIRSAISTKA